MQSDAYIVFVFRFKDLLKKRNGPLFGFMVFKVKITALKCSLYTL